MKKKIFKTTTEYTYDKEGRVIKEVETVEEYEEEVVSNITFPDSIKRTTGVIPNTGTISSPWTTTTSYDSAKADTNGITHNVTINACHKTGADMQKIVKDAISKIYE